MPGQNLILAITIFVFICACFMVYRDNKKNLQKDVDLVLCGHTHAGQIFPFSILVLLDQGFLHGLYKINDKMQAYVSSGAGFWGPPVRIFAPSEIAILNLSKD